MICPNCNTNVPDGAAFCPTCGVMLTQQPPQQPYGAYDPNQPNPYGAPPMPPMKWYKFLIYFSLFAGGILNILFGLRAFLSMFTDADTIAIYNRFPILRVSDMIVALLAIAMGAIAFYTRGRLAKFCANGPKLLTTLYTLDAIAGLITLLAVVVVLPGTDISSQVGSIAGSVALIFINRAYFKKRAYLFVN